MLKKPVGRSTVENPDVPVVLWLMGQIPWLSQLSVYPCTMDEVVIHQSLPSLSFCPTLPTPWIIMNLTMLCGLTNRMQAQMILPVPSWDLTSCKVIPLATLGVVNYAMTRTGPRNWSKKKKHENKHEGNVHPEAEPPRPTGRPRSKKQNAYCSMLLVFCGWFLGSITVSTTK